MDKPQALYIIGEPGVGKSTLVEALTAGLPYDETAFPFPYRYYDCGVMELGIRREEFSGTDAYPLNIQPAVENYIESLRPKMLIAEGDRLANGKFFAHLMAMGYELRVVHLVGKVIADLRRRERAVLLKRPMQSETWLKGRQTKVLRLAVDYGSWTQSLSAEFPPSKTAGAIISPVAERLRETQKKLRVPA